MARTVDAKAGSTVWRRSEAVAYVESEGRAAVLDLDHLDRPPYVFEDSAAEIWARVDGVRTEDQVAQELADAYGVPPGEVAPDVRGFIERLGSLGLLVTGALGD